MHTHTRSVAHKVFDVWRSPGRFTKNPDVVQLPSGRLLLIYSDTDQHWSEVDQVLTLLASDDLGRTWRKAAEVARADLAAGDERLVTPRLSLLADGRLVVLCDHDDYGHFHEDQPSGNWAWWSEDEGRTWSAGECTGIRGFEPDRMMDLPGGGLGVCTHMMRGESQEFAEVLSRSDDGGATWHEAATIAHDGYHRFCEGALVVLDGGAELACVMRENHSAGIPCFVAFSQDNGATWSAPQMLPFALHRPYAKQLPDGRVLVTGRHVNGGIGTYAWCGDLRAEAGTYALGGPRRETDACLTPDALLIRNAPGRDCRYSLLPPEDAFSELDYEAELSVEGPADQPVAFISVSRYICRGGAVMLEIAPNWIALSGRQLDTMRRIDMTRPHRLRLVHRRGLLTVQVDGEEVLRQTIFHETAYNQDFFGADPRQRTQFGQLGEAGSSTWRSVSYSVANRTLDDFSWSWRAADGRWPDQYQRDRLIQIHANDPERGWPDHGYSSWVLLEDGRIFLADYTNCGDEQGKSHLVGVYLDPEDIA